MKLIIHPEASAEIEEEAAYYEDKQSGLGLEFLDGVDAAIDTILSMPYTFAIRRKNIRMYVLPRFPFSILYRVQSEILEILIVRHHARNEDYGMNR